VFCVRAHIVAFFVSKRFSLHGESTIIIYWLWSVLTRAVVCACVPLYSHAAQGRCRDLYPIWVGYVFSFFECVALSISPTACWHDMDSV
jgi:hypothetical protein